MYIPIYICIPVNIYACIYIPVIRAGGCYGACGGKPHRLVFRPKKSMYICVCICKYLYTCIYMSIYMHTHTYRSFAQVAATALAMGSHIVSHFVR